MEEKVNNLLRYIKILVFFFGKRSFSEFIDKQAIKWKLHSIYINNFTFVTFEKHCSPLISSEFFFASSKKQMDANFFVRFLRVRSARF